MITRNQKQRTCYNCNQEYNRFFEHFAVCQNKNVQVLLETQVKTQPAKLIEQKNPQNINFENPIEEQKIQVGQTNYQIDNTTQTCPYCNIDFSNKLNKTRFEQHEIQCASSRQICENCFVTTNEKNHLKNCKLKINQIIF